MGMPGVRAREALVTAAWRAALAGALVLATASGAAARQVDAKKVAPRRQAIIYVDPSLDAKDDYFTHPRILEETTFLEARGYTVTTVAATQRVIADDIVRNILGAQPPIGAMAFFGHGGEDKGGVLVPTFAGRTADEWHVQMRWVYHGRDDNGNPIELEFFFRQ